MCLSNLCYWFGDCVKSSILGMFEYVAPRYIFHDLGNKDRHIFELSNELMDTLWVYDEQGHL